MVACPAVGAHARAGVALPVLAAMHRRRVEARVRGELAGAAGEAGGADAAAPAALAVGATLHDLRPRARVRRQLAPRAGPAVGAGAAVAVRGLLAHAAILAPVVVALADVLAAQLASPAGLALARKGVERIHAVHAVAEAR